MTKQQIIKKFTKHHNYIYYKGKFYNFTYNEIVEAFQFYFNDYEKILKFTNVKDITIHIEEQKNNFSICDLYLETFFKIKLYYGEYDFIDTQLILFHKLNN